MDERERREEARKRAVLAGDAGAWRAWYDEAFDRLDAYTLWRCGGLRDHADDIIQDTWLTAIRRLAQFEPSAGPFLAWLRGIAAHLARNRFRREARHRSAALPAPGEDEPADAEAQRRERGEQIAAALASLSDRYEDVLRARYLEGLSVAEISERRCETLKTVESLLSRAREAFRAVYPHAEEVT